MIPKYNVGDILATSGYTQMLVVHEIRIRKEAIQYINHDEDVQVYEEEIYAKLIPMLIEEN